MVAYEQSRPVRGHHAMDTEPNAQKLEQKPMMQLRNAKGMIALTLIIKPVKGDRCNRAREKNDETHTREDRRAAIVSICV